MATHFRRTEMLQTEICTKLGTYAVAQFSPHDESIADRTREIRRAEVTIRSARIGIGKHHALMDDAANFTGDIAAFRDNGLGHRWRGEQYYRGHPRNHGKSM